MIAALLLRLRAVPFKVWLILGLAVAALALALAVHDAGRRAEREAQAVETARAEARAAAGRETAATERTLDNAGVDRRLEEWNHAAEQIPDEAPDQRELRRRCRQLWDAGDRDVPECRGLAR